VIVEVEEEKKKKEKEVENKRKAALFCCESTADMIALYA
jgi:hypothetical protein